MIVDWLQRTRRNGFPAGIIAMGAPKLPFVSR